MTDESHCPRCGATLPQDDEVMCPGCGYAIGGRTVAIEVSPDELLAEMERRRTDEVSEDSTGPMPNVVTSPSGLLKTDAGIDAVAKPEVAKRSRSLLVAATVVVVAVVLLLAILAVIAAGR